MDQFIIKVKRDGRLDVPKQLVTQLGKRVKNVSLSKRGKSIVITDSGDYELASDGRFRVAAYEIAAIGLSPGDTAKIKYMANRNCITVSAV